MGFTVHRQFISMVFNFSISCKFWILASQDSPSHSVSCLCCLSSRVQKCSPVDRVPYTEPWVAAVLLSSVHKVLDYLDVFVSTPYVLSG